MARVNVFNYPDPSDPDQEIRLAGWFDPDSATKFHEDETWDGDNYISVNVGRFNHQCLYRSKSGRWILNTWSDWSGTPETYQFVTDEVAKDWLLRNNGDDSVEEFFGEIEEESGPDLGGRPSEGKKIEVRIPDDTLALIEDRAKAEGTTRSEMIRRLVTAGLGL